MIKHHHHVGVVMGERSYIFSREIFSEVKIGAPRRSVPKVGAMTTPLYPDKGAFATILAAVMAPWPPRPCHRISIIRVSYCLVWRVQGILLCLRGAITPRTHGKERKRENVDFNLTEDQRMIRDTVRDFAQGVIAPRAAEIDRSGAFPRDIFTQMGELGLMGLPIAEEYGGSGADYTSYCLALEEITRACASTGLGYEAHISLGCMPINYFGTEEQKQECLPVLCSGESMGSFGLTEPQAGTDAANQKTTAVLDGNEWVSNGSKIFITNGGPAGVALVIAATDKAAAHKGLSAFIVPADAKGYKVARRSTSSASALPPRPSSSSRTAGSPRRTSSASPAKGSRSHCRRSTAAASASRPRRWASRGAHGPRRRVLQGARPVRPVDLQLPGIQWKLADMATEVEAARRSDLYAAWCNDKGGPSRSRPQAKLQGRGNGHRAADGAIQIHGGYGYIKESPWSATSATPELRDSRRAPRK